MGQNKIKDITIVSLSRGILGENFIRHELDLGLKRLEAYGINVHFAKHALLGLDYIAAHPEVIGNPDLPVVVNVNVGHAIPRCIIPFGIHAKVNVEKQKNTFEK